MISQAIILLGDTNPESCAAEIEKSTALNLDSIKSVIDYLKHLQIKPVFASSEFVFDGTRGNYTEWDPVNPILTYGRQKVDIERYLQNSCDEFIIVRLAKVFGSQRGDRTLFTSWLDAIERCETILCAYDQVFSPIYIDDVVEGIMRLVETNSSGIFHLSGRKPFSRIALLEMLLTEVRRYSALNVK